MTVADGGTTVEFDHHSSEFAADPWPVLADLRERCPVAHSAAYGGFWVVTRYEDIRRIALDDVTFSSAQSITIPAKKNVGQRSIPIEVDPPMFQKYRKIMHPLFTPNAVAKLEPAIGAFTDRCIDDFIESGTCDIVHDLADPLPALTTLHMLGLPTELWRKFSEPLHATVFLRQDSPKRAGQLEGLLWIRDYLAKAVAERRDHPRDDMITHLTRATLDGRTLTDTEVLEMVTLTVQGGFDTTGSAISSALLQLDNDRAARERLIAEPDRIPRAVEEFLRYEAPQFALARTATRDVEVGGQLIRQGEQLLLVWASGNRDDTMFDHPERLELDRFPNRHMTFGLGAHRCLGSTLARKEIIAALSAVLRRMPDYEVDRSRVVRAETIGVTYGCFALGATFTPGPRVGPPPQ
jgi:cytochrome P450